MWTRLNCYIRFLRLSGPKLGKNISDAKEQEATEGKNADFEKNHFLYFFLFYIRI